jgi:hypothetical protein
MKKSSLAFIQTRILIGIKQPTNKAQITGSRRYLGKVKYERFSKTKYLLILVYLMVKGTSHV